jgi:hypothetical protein
MEAVLERRRGLDVHKKSVAACVITPQGREIRTFRSMTHLPVHDQGVAGIG